MSAACKIDLSPFEVQVLFELVENRLAGMTVVDPDDLRQARALEDSRDRLKPFYRPRVPTPKGYGAARPGPANFVRQAPGIVDAIESAEDGQPIETLSNVIAGRAQRRRDGRPPIDRRKFAHAWLAGLSPEAIAAQFDMTVNHVYRLRETLQLKPRRIRPKKRPCHAQA
jgi:DNA-directed RNA polymerase specialized sigma24 family protein